MVDITKIPDNELIEDRFQSLCDIKACEEGLSMGVFFYSNGKSVSRRLYVNEQIVIDIEAELARRGIGFTT